MTWRTSTGRDKCTIGQHAIPEAALVYTGTTTATFCEAHAASELHQEPPDSVEIPRHEHGATGLDRMTREALHRLLMKHAPAVARTWGERE